MSITPSPHLVHAEHPPGCSAHHHPAAAIANTTGEHLSSLSSSPGPHQAHHHPAVPAVLPVPPLAAAIANTTGDHLSALLILSISHPRPAALSCLSPSSSSHRNATRAWWFPCHCMPSALLLCTACCTVLPVLSLQLQQVGTGDPFLSCVLTSAWPITCLTLLDVV